MRILCAFLMMFQLASVAHAGETGHYGKLKIYDKGEFTSTTYFNAAVSTNTVRTDFVGMGRLRTSSKLKGSTARIIDCPEPVNERIRNKITDYRETKKEPAFPEFKIGQCIQIDYPDAIIYFVEFEYHVSLVNAKISDQKGIPIVWVGMQDKTRLKEICFYYSRLDSGSEGYVQVDLAGVADVDRDGRHEIVINYIGYAGRLYHVLGFKDGKLFQQEIHGDSWD